MSYKLNIILKEHGCNSICYLCKIIIRGCRSWYSAFAGLAARLAASVATNIATGFANGRANDRTNNRAARLAVSGTNDWVLGKTNEGDDRTNSRAARLATSKINS